LWDYCGETEVLTHSQMCLIFVSFTCINDFLLIFMSAS